MSESESVKRSKRFNKPDADVTFKSSDGVLFALHKKNLYSLSKGFPSSDNKVESEVIDLPEDSETLELLFQFVYMDDHPDLFDISMTLFFKFAYAAEKYGVHFAIGICKIRILHCVRIYNKSSSSFHDTEVETLRSITKFTAYHAGYTKVLDEVAPLLAMSIPLSSSLPLFPADQQLSWAVYRDQWLGYHDKLQYHIKDGNCGACMYSFYGPFRPEFWFNMEHIGFSAAMCLRFKDKHKDIPKFSAVCENPYIEAMYDGLEV